MALLSPPPPPFGLYTIRGPIYVEPSSLQPASGVLPVSSGPPVRPVGPPAYGPSVPGHWHITYFLVKLDSNCSNLPVLSHQMQSSSPYGPYVGPFLFDQDDDVRINYNFNINFWMFFFDF